MTRYLVTGGAGFIGTNYIKFLFERYEEEVQVINLDALTYCGRRDNLRELENLEKYRFIEGDVCDEELLHTLFRENEIDYIVHFAAQSHVDRSIEEAKEFVRTNIKGTCTLLAVAKEAWGKTGKNWNEKRFLYVSTDEVYGELSERGFFTEESPFAPRNPYSVSKASADMMAKAYYETYGFPVVITRCSNNYGAYQDKEKLIPICVKQILAGSDVKVYGDGKNVRDWLYVTDHCNAIERVLRFGRLGEAYNVGGHNEKTTVEIVETIMSIMESGYEVKRPSIEYVSDRLGHDRRYAIDPTKITEELGWKPRVKFEEGICETVAWYMKHKEYIKD